MSADIGWFTSQTLTRIFPYVVGQSWVEYAGEDALVTWQFSDDVCLVLVVDDVGTVRNVRPEDLAGVNVSPEEAFGLAAENLAKAYQAQAFEFGVAELIDGLPIGMVKGSWMAPAGGLLLRNFYEVMAQQFQEQAFVAVAVNQQCLIAFPDMPQYRESSSLKKLIEDFSGGVPKPISRKWLVGVDPVSRTPDRLRKGVQRCRRVDCRIRQPFAIR